MVYQYQEETIDEIDNACYSIEKMTEEKYRVHIGWRHTNKLEEENIPIYVEINTNNRFVQQTNLDSQYGTYSRCELWNENRVELNNDIFLDLNKLIDKIIEDNKKRKEFIQKNNQHYNFNLIKLTFSALDNFICSLYFSLIISCKSGFNNFVFDLLLIAIILFEILII